MIDLPKPVRIFNRPLMHVPEIYLTIVCWRIFIIKQNVSKKKIFIILQLMNCKLAKFDTSVEIISKWQCRIRIALGRLIPEPREICLVLVCGSFAINARTATLFASCVTGLLRWRFVLSRASDRYCRLYDPKEYFDQDEFYCAVAAFTQHFFYIRRKWEFSEP
jgi:hypothetical protein